MCLARALTGVFSSSSGNVALFSGVKLKTPAASALSQNQKVNLNRDGVPGELMPSFVVLFPDLIHICKFNEWPCEHNGSRWRIHV